MDQIEYIKSNKGGIKIIYKGYMYTVHKNKKCGGIRWRCAQRSLNCKGSMSTTVSGSPFINMPHNHLPDCRSVITARSKFEVNLHEHLFTKLLALETAAVLPNVWEPLTTLKDSMPLEQRLKAAVPEPEPVLQSQPLSPTKLKVTRQSTKPPQPSPKPVTPEVPNEEVCLRWNSHHSNMQTSFPNLLLKEQYVDATLVAEGQSLRCHRLILSSCSPYFEEVLSGISPFQHPVLFMKDIPFWVLKSLCDFMYAGEVHIFQNKLEELLAVAESLKIKGLAGKTEGSKEEAKNTETVKEEKKEEKEKEVKEKKRSFQHVDPPPKVTPKVVRSVYPSKKLEKAKEPLNKGGILDPLDLLEPVYEEVTKEMIPPKLKEIKSISLKKGKLKKRKISEEREESPPPLFLSRKGTRSRPNVKIPKYYHTHYERVPDATIVREPHTDQPDPLLQLEEIKAEPLDMDDDVIEIEDNVIEFPDIVPHDEEIIGNYDSPLVNLNDKIDKTADHTTFKKISLVPQPIIMNVHTIAEKSPASLQLVDLCELKGAQDVTDKVDDPLASVSDVESDKAGDDPLVFDNTPAQKGAEGITITNVQSIADMEEEMSVDASVGSENAKKAEQIEPSSNEFRIENVVNEKEGGEIEILSEKESQEIDPTVVIPVISVDVGEKENVKGKTSITITNVQSIADIEEEISVDSENAKKEEQNEPPSDKFRIGKVASEKEDREIEILSEKGSQASESAVIIPVIVTDLDETESVEGKTSITQDLLGLKLSQDSVAANSSEPELENDSQTSNDETQVEVSLLELGNKIVNDGEEETGETEEGSTEPGFHIAKVASEQFSVNEANVDSAVISENCANELGFQITNVVSGHFEDSDVKMGAGVNASDSETFPNHLSETEGEVNENINVAQPEDSEMFSQETQFLADSLEKLLDN